MQRKIYAAAVATALAAMATAVADVDWPADFDSQLATHIAAERSANTSSGFYDMQVDSCYRTVGKYDLAVARNPGSGLYFIIR